MYKSSSPFAIPLAKESVTLMATLQTFKIFLVVSGVGLLVSAELTPDFYDGLCPEALETIKLAVEDAIAVEPRMGASLLRLHFHDCFVNVRLLS